VPPTYKIALLKNEFGDVAVDSLLVQQGSSSIATVKEMLNGCVCCVLVGQMSNALKEIRDVHRPDRIIVETSGSAFPAPIAWQIRQLAPEGFKLDAIVTVVDCANFRGYEDRSYTAKMQAQYTDLILLNKHEQVAERDLDEVIDRINDLNTDTPRIKVNVKNGDVQPDLLFGLDTRLFETMGHSHYDSGHHEREVDLISVRLVVAPSTVVDVSALAALPKENVFRIKGTIPGSNGLAIVNIAFGRYEEPTAVGSNHTANTASVNLTFMGDNLRDVLPGVHRIFGNPSSGISLHERHDH